MCASTTQLAVPADTVCWASPCFCLEAVQHGLQTLCPVTVCACGCLFQLRRRVAAVQCRTRLCTTATRTTLFSRALCKILCPTNDTKGHKGMVTAYTVVVCCKRDLHTSYCAAAAAACVWLTIGFVGTALMSHVAPLQNWLLSADIRVQRVLHDD
jgi:hypothetical protein